MTNGAIYIFDDGKDPGALRTIGEVSKALGIAAHVLRYWEQQFPMLQPLKRSGGRRYYRAADIALVQSIDRLVNREGYTLRGACKALQSDRTDVPPAMDSGQAARNVQPALSPEILPQLRSIRLRLAAALEN